MKLTVGIADTVIGIRLLGEAERAISLCLQYFEDYLCPGRRIDANIRISVLKNPDKTSPFKKMGRKRLIEGRLSTNDVTAWLENIPGQIHDFPLTARTLSFFFLGGVLLFNPDTSDGCILLKEGAGPFRPLYRLLWMYLAQVLGERRGCFVHSAALVRNEKGYLFIGPSGAGKTTLAKRFGGSMIFSDDGPVLRPRNGDYFVFPSPYRQTVSLKGQAGDLPGMSARVEGLYFLIQDDRTYLEGLSKREALPLIISRHILFFPYLSAGARAHLFNLFFDICDRIPLHNLHVCLDQDIWEAIDSSARRLT